MTDNTIYNRKLANWGKKLQKTVYEHGYLDNSL